MTRKHTTALVTGASSGIGLELANLLAADHRDLVLVSRDRKKLDGIAAELEREHHVDVLVIAQDLSAVDGAKKVYRIIVEEHRHVDILVNNAGFGLWGNFNDLDLEKQLNMMQLNMMALTELTGLFLPKMLKRRRGHILNLASMASFEPGPLMAVYYASKAYVASFSQALNNELEGTGVSVSALCPGATRSGFQKRSGTGDMKAMQGNIMTPREVALDGYRGMMARRPLVVPGLRNRLMLWGQRFVPRSTTVRMVRRMQERA